MTLEELEAAVSGLQQDKQNQALEQQFGGFQSKFGDAWSGDEQLGRVFFDTLGAQDADLENEAFAGAVEKLIENAKAEVSMLSQKLKGFQQQMQETTDKMQAISDAAASVGIAPQDPASIPDLTGILPPQDMGAGVPPMGAPPLDGAEAGAPIPGDMGAVPTGPEAGGGAPPSAGPEAGGGTPPPSAGGDAGGAPPPSAGPEAGGVPPPAPGPEEQKPPVPSDERLKTVISDERLKQIKSSVQSKPAPKMWTPPSHMLKGIVHGI